MCEVESKKLSDETKISPELAKRIIDNLSARDLDIAMFNQVLYSLRHEIQEKALEEKLNKSTTEEIDNAIDELIGECMLDTCLSEFTLAEGEAWTEDKEYELVTTAKQTSRHNGDFQFSKSDIELMVKNFNDDVVGTEIPVDLNHDPDHEAYAWIKPRSLRVGPSSKLK